MPATDNIEMKEVYKPELVNGVFTVNDSGKKVKFTKGNLYWNGSEFKCEDSQIAYPTTRNADHIGLFYWSKTASIAYAVSYSDSDKTTSDVFFAANGGAIEGYTVLSNNEWEYVLSHSLVVNPPVTKSTIVMEEDVQIEINGVNCIVLMPDGFSGTVKSSYTAEEWTEAEKTGLVALPFAGFYDESGFRGADIGGHYWSSTPKEDDTDYGLRAYFDDETVAMGQFPRCNGYSVRLVQVQ